MIQLIHTSSSRQKKKDEVELTKYTYIRFNLNESLIIKFSIIRNIEEFIIYYIGKSRNKIFKKTLSNELFIQTCSKHGYKILLKMCTGLTKKRDTVGSCFQFDLK